MKNGAGCWGADESAAGQGKCLPQVEPGLAGCQTGVWRQCSGGGNDPVGNDEEDSRDEVGQHEGDVM